LAGDLAYLDGLKMLARRELSEAQVRQRLARRDHSADDIEAAIARLRGERAIDDARAAEAIARTETTLRRRGRARVQMQIERAGIAKTVARDAIDRVFAEIDDQALMEAALSSRLHGRPPIRNDRDLARVYRYLVAQGFEPHRVLRRLELLRRDARK
jgi:regulatory protein